MLRRLTIATAIVLTVLALAACSRATEAHTLQLARLYSADQIQAEWFSESFTRRTPLTRIQEIVDGHRDQLGGLQRVEPSRQGYTVHLAKGQVPVTIHLNPEGLIDGLFFKPVVITRT